MSSDNPSGAVNQQERPCSAEWLDALPADLGNWVAGFVDGEGSFNVPIRRLRSGSMPFRISLSSTCPSSDRRSLGFFETCSVREPSGDAVTASTTTRSQRFESSLDGSFRSSSATRCVAPSATTSSGSKELLRSSSQVGTCRLKGSKRSSQ
jgi:hypothetical protein